MRSMMRVTIDSISSGSVAPGATTGVVEAAAAGLASEAAVTDSRRFFLEFGNWLDLGLGCKRSLPGR